MMSNRREFLRDLFVGTAGLAVLPQLALAQATGAVDPWKTVYQSAEISETRFCHYEIRS
jgi:hypothetical protein